MNGPTATGVSNDPGLVVYPPGTRSKAPQLEGTTLDGDAFTLSEYSGNIIVINVWGSWCGPCRAETPDLVRLARQNADREVRFLGINTRDNLGSARAFVKKFKVPYPSLFDEGGRVLLPFRGVIPTAVIPSTVVIDREGKVAARVIGPVTYNTLKGVLDDELAGGKK
ncbi:MAG: TlpA disulfide reductase family protein [Marmoricola sp.]